MDAGYASTMSSWTTNAFTETICWRLQRNKLVLQQIWVQMPRWLIPIFHAHGVVTMIPSSIRINRNERRHEWFCFSSAQSVTIVSRIRHYQLTVDRKWKMARKWEIILGVVCSTSDMMYICENTSIWYSLSTILVAISFHQQVIYILSFSLVYQPFPFYEWLILANLIFALAKIYDSLSIHRVRPVPCQRSPVCRSWSLKSQDGSSICSFLTFMSQQKSPLFASRNSRKLRTT